MRRHPLLTVAALVLLLIVGVICKIRQVKQCEEAGGVMTSITATGYCVEP
jgi:hypothetical protein